MYLCFGGEGCVLYRALVMCVCGGGGGVSFAQLVNYVSQVPVALSLYTICIRHHKAKISNSYSMGDWDLWQ